MLIYIEEENYNIDIRFEVLTTVVKGIFIFWYIIPLCPLKLNRGLRKHITYIPEEGNYMFL
jgi:hypothetical protein